MLVRNLCTNYPVFYCQTVFFPFPLRITLHAMNLLVHLSEQFFKSDLLPRTKIRCGLQSCSLAMWNGFPEEVNSPHVGMAMLCGVAVVSQSRGKADEGRWLGFAGNVFKGSIQTSGSERAPSNSSLVYLHPSAFILVGKNDGSTS